MSCLMSFLLCLVLVWLEFETVFAWDGDWTTGVSGDNALFYYDEDSTQNKAGTDPPQKYFQPVPRDFADVDPDELTDYFDRYNREYAPYALLRVTRPLEYPNSQPLRVGYYLIKLGAWGAGSPNLHLDATSQPSPVTPPEPLPPDSTIYSATYRPALHNMTGNVSVGHHLELSPQEKSSRILNQTPSLKNDALRLIESPAYPRLETQTSQTQNSHNPSSNRLKKELEPPNVFVVIYNGKVVAVYPIENILPYRPSRKEKIPSRRPLAWVEVENRQPVLKYYYKRQLYSTVFP